MGAADPRRFTLPVYPARQQMVHPREQSG
jgi:hypothetical protein